MESGEKSRIVSGSQEVIGSIPKLALELLAASHGKVQEGAKKGKENNHQDPDDFIIS